MSGGHLEEIDREECLSLLAQAIVGRVATSLPGEAPLVVPVNFVMDGEVVVFRSDLGAKVFGLRQGPVSFQVDHIDQVHRSGWSVLVQGLAYESTEEEISHLALEPWAEGERLHWVRLVPKSISGRRIALSGFRRNADGYL